MASSGPRKRKRGDAMDRDDIISRLPGEIKDKILAKLPIKDAVRTSILSTNWRYTWALMPEIVVKDDDLVPIVDGDPLLAKLHFFKNVDLLLLTHNGPILKFDLSTQYHFPGAFDRWMLNLSRNRITERTFLLNLASISKYRIHSSFFCCDALQHVGLSGCLIELPCGFEGFKLLKTLKLNKCTISTADLEYLVSSCPNLVRLSLKGFQTEDDLRIFSAELKFLTVGGDFSDLQIDAPNLTSLFIGFYNYKNSPPRVRCVNKFCQSLSGLSNIQQIRLLGFSVQYLIDRSPAELLNLCLTELNSVYLSVDLADQKESGFTFSLLQNATKLQDLFLCVNKSENTTSSGLWDKDIVFNSLQIVQIRRFSEPVLAFVKFVLSSSPNLIKLTLMEDPKSPKEGNPEIFKRLLKFQRASTRAEVIFE